LQIFSNGDDAHFTNLSYTITTAGGALVLRSVRLNTAVDNIVALTTMGLQIFTYNQAEGEIGAGKLYPLPGQGIDVVSGSFGDDPRPDIAVLTQLGCFIFINQSGA
ncbi:MAG TPA: hypothetical protein VIK91_01035, partial [Nannocystis sp.]